MAEQYLVSKKYHEISMFVGETARKVSKNGEEWTKYLTTAARLYKYPFEDQMLIYAQRPDASACNTMETWNEKMFCWVNRGARALLYLDDLDMLELSNRIIGKLRNMTDEEFEELELAEAD